ncbi:MAG: hypothetical protein MI976_07685 [Pseudomonadales bacterium]|nr:hypothetical protein [Pseudomonadales bacterium]
MANESNVFKELANISMSISELAAVKAIIWEEIESQEFRDQFADLLSDMVNSYQVVLKNLQPFAQINTPELFSQHFDTRRDELAQSYSVDNGIPRANAEFTYEKYLEFRQLKITRTSYPLLKVAFARLHAYIDKWLDNDIWLAMSIDVLFKMTFRVMEDIAQQKPKDSETAYKLFRSCAAKLPPYLAIIEHNCQIISNSDRETMIPIIKPDLQDAATPSFA